MTLNELRYIVAVAQERSFGRAAAKCFVSQPALSVAIQKIEDELQAPLFERGKSEVTITPVGARIVEQAQRVLEEVARIREIAQAGRNQLVGPLRLGVIYTVAPYLLPDLIPALLARAPQMPLAIEENLTESLEVALKTGRIDAAIVALPFGPPGVVTHFLYEEPTRSSSRRATSGRSASPCTPRSSRRSTRWRLDVRPLLPRPGAGRLPGAQPGRHDDHADELARDRRDMGLALGPDITVLPRDALTPKYHSRLVVPVPFTKPAPTRRVALAARKSFPRPEAIEALLAAVADCRATVRQASLKSRGRTQRALSDVPAAAASTGDVAPVRLMMEMVMLQRPSATSAVPTSSTARCTR